MDYGFDGLRPALICAVNCPTELRTLLRCICKYQQESGAVNLGLTSLAPRFIRGQATHIC